MLECVKTPALCLSGTKWNWARQQRTQLSVPQTQLAPAWWVPPLPLQHRGLSPRVSLCASEVGRHFRPARSLLPFILNGALGPQKPHCVSKQLSYPEGPSKGSSLWTPTDTHSRSSFHVSHLFINISQFCDQSPPLWVPVWLIALADIQCILDFVCPLH